MGRTMTIRGTLDGVSFNNIPEEKLILSYESPDRTKAWKVTGAFVWPLDNTYGIPTNPKSSIDHASGYMAVLQTDTIPRTTNEKFLAAEESRNIAWLNASNYQVLNGPGGYQFSGQLGTGFVQGTDMLIDVDRLVTNQLYLSAIAYTASGDNPGTLALSYMVVLEEVKVSNSQSLLQQLKGIGQDISA